MSKTLLRSPRSLVLRVTLALLASAIAVSAAGQDRNISHPIPVIEKLLAETPLQVVEMEQARPSIQDDRSIRIVLDGADGAAPITAKLKPVGSSAMGYNNEPRYDLAAYRLQTLFLDEEEYVVPPIVLRSAPLDAYRALQPQAEPTLRNTSSVLYVLAYWLDDVTNIEPFQQELFETDPSYARHWGNLNILTHLIDHGDGNLGNLLISTVAGSRRVFAVDNDVAFGSGPSNHGDPWSQLRVDRLPAETVERLRALTEENLAGALGVLAEFEKAEGDLIPVALGPNLAPRRGVRVDDNRVQLGLTETEIRSVRRRIERMLRRIDRGHLETFSRNAVGIY